MNALITIMSCATLQHQEQAQRDTWLKNSPVPYLFYGGIGYKATRQDQKQFDGPDDYMHVFQKVQKLYAFALEQKFDFIFQAYLDTYMNLGRALDGRLFDKNYAGHRTCGGDDAHWVPVKYDEYGRSEYACGGSGIWLSAAAMRAILASGFYHWCDDLAIGTCLARAGIQLWHDPRFQKHGEFLRPGSATTHLSKGTGNYHESWMYECHRFSL